MSRKTIKVFALLLTMCMVFSLAACSKKQITADKFMSAIEDNGLVGEVIPEGSAGGEESGIIEGAVGSGTLENQIFSAYYYRFSSKEAAVEKYESVLAEYKKITDSEEVKGTVDESGKANMKRVLVNANPIKEDGGLGIYSVTVQVDKIVITLVAMDNNADAIEKIDSILKDCGYYYP